MSVTWESLRRGDGPAIDVATLRALAASWESSGRLDAAATALDLAWARDPSRPDVGRDRARVLDALAFCAHGITWRYVPAGPFVMGTEEGEDDEGPAHVVELGPYWVSDAPVTWARYCALAGYAPPPNGMTRPVRDAAGNFDAVAFGVANDNKIRRRYCADDPRSATEAYDDRPMVAVSWQMGDALGRALTTTTATVRMPTEAEWEKAARGGLAGARYPWGDADPTPARADHARFEAFSLRSPREFAPNGYGIFAMAGGVWEWTVDDYDAEWYASSPRRDPRCVATGREKVLRGGSWADSATVLRVTYRMSRAVRGERNGAAVEYSASTPNVGLRLVWVETASASTPVEGPPPR